MAFARYLINIQTCWKNRFTSLSWRIPFTKVIIAIMYTIVVTAKTNLIVFSKDMRIKSLLAKSSRVNKLRCTIQEVTDS